MLVLLTLFGCMNAPDRMWGGGGTRYATGVAATGLADTAGDTGGGSSAGNAPEITAIEGSLEAISGVDGVLTGSVSYTDAQDDVVGGTLFNTLQGQGSEDHNLDVYASEDEAPVGSDAAWVSSEGVLRFQIYIFPDDWAVRSSLTDEAGHSSDYVDWIAYLES